MKHYLLAALLGISLAAGAKTYTFQDLSKVDTTGVTQVKEGVYLVSKDFTVPAGDVLVLDNLSTIRMAKDVMIYVNGEAQLAPADSATICADNEADPCKGFQFTADGSNPTLIKNVIFQMAGLRYVTDGPLTVENCKFFNTSSNINSGAAAISFVRSNGGNLVKGCTFTNCYGAAIAGGANIATGITIENCTLTNCVTSNTNRPYLNLTVGGNNDVVIKGNKIYGAKLNMPGAITVANLLSLAGTNKILIENNYADNCRYGINIMGKATARIINNRLVNNHYETNANNGGSGVTAYASTVYLEGNHIEGSLWGVTLVGGANGNLGKIENPEADDYNPGGNTFLNNGNCGTAPEGADSPYDPTKPYDLYNNTPNEVYAQNCTWSVPEQTEELIETVIFHYADNSQLGKVIFMPAFSKVATIDADNEVVSTTWYTLDGQQVASPAEGSLYIRIDKMANGTIEAVKTIK